MEKNVKLIGHVFIPSYVSKRNVCKCDYCGNVVDDSFGDSRTVVTIVHSNGAKEINYICSDCDNLNL